MRVSLVLVVVILAAASAIGCGSGDTQTLTGETTEASNQTTAARNQTGDRPPGAPAYAHAADWKLLKRLAGQWSDRLLVPNGPSPDKVLIRDLKQGSGPVIEPNDPFRVNYAAFYYKNGKVRENEWEGYAGLTYWDTSWLVDAWMPGLKGMREGGIRELIAPSSWAYDNGPLVYLVKVVKIEPR